MDDPGGSIVSFKGFIQGPGPKDCRGDPEDGKTHERLSPHVQAREENGGEGNNA